MSKGFSTGARFVLIFAAVIIIIAGMKAAQVILVPFLLSCFIAVISAPLLLWLQSRGLSSGLSVLSVLFILLLLGGLVILPLGTSVDDFARSSELYQINLRERLAGLLAWLDGKGVEISRETVFRYLDPQAAMKAAGGLAQALGAMLTHSFLILLTVSFILLEVSTFPSKLHQAWEGRHSIAKLENFTSHLRRYLAIKTSISLVTGALVWLWLVILNIDYPVLWGVLAFLLNYVPSIGSLIAAVPAVLLAFIQFGPAHMLYTALGYVFINVSLGSIIEPRLMGHGLGLSALVVFLSLVFWGWVLGPVGMLLSVPLTMTVKIALESKEDTRWLAILLGPGTPLKGAVRVKDPA